MEDKLVTPEEAYFRMVVMEIEGMVESSLAALFRFAEVLIECRRPSSNGLLPGDLVHEAIVLTLVGTRVWYQERHKTMKEHIENVMCSLVSHEIESPKEERLDRASDVPDPDAEIRTDEEEEFRLKVTKLRKACIEDRDGLTVVEGLVRQLKPADIRRRAGMNETQYNRARMFVLRKAEALEGGSDVA